MSGNRLENLRTLRWANADAAFSTSFITLTTGAFLVGFVQLLGGSDLWIGLLSAVPSLVGLLQIPGAIWGRSFPSYKRFVTPAGLAWRLLYVPLVFLPLLVVWPGELRLTIMAALVLVASGAIALVQPIYNDWLAEMIPSNSRGWYFSRRNAIGAAVGAAVGIVGGFVLDGFRARDQAPAGFSAVFALGVGCGLGSLFFYSRMRDVPRERPVRQSVAEGLRAVAGPFRDRRFRRVVLFLAFAVFGQTFAGNLFVAYGRESLGLDFKLLQGLAVTMAAGNLLSAPLWGFLADRYGNKPVLTLALAVVSLNPLAWIACAPGNPTQNAWVLLVSHVGMGIGWAGVALCQLNLVLATAPGEDRANYLGAGLTTMAVMGGVAPLAGASLRALLRGSLDPVTAYRIIFGSSIVLRALSIGLLYPVAEQGASRFRTTWRDLRQVSAKGVRTLRSLEGDAEARETALEALGEERLGLASDAVLHALQDPSPRVRRQAAATIARLGDARATEGLVEQIEAYPELAEEEAVDALGLVAGERALPGLQFLLASPRSNLRRAAARAIGRIADREGAPPGAVRALIEAANSPDDIDLRRAALQALRATEAPEAAEALRRALADPHPSVRIAAAEGVAELGVDAAPELRASLNGPPDPASPELAYALGGCGDAGDLACVLKVAGEAVTPVARRRALLGAARLLGVEGPAYRLLLRTGLARDAALLELARGSRDPRLADALARYGAGDEPGALARLTETATAAFADQAVPESFLVLASAYVRDGAGRLSGRWARSRGES